MRKYCLMIIGIFIILLFLISGCSPKESISGETKTPALSAEDQQILEQYPDDLDDSLQELEQVG